MSLSDDQIRRIARLARIAIGDEESTGVRDRLNRVLGLIDQLQAVDTTGIEPMSHALDVVQPLRVGRSHRGRPARREPEGGSRGAKAGCTSSPGSSSK